MNPATETYEDTILAGLQGELTPQVAQAILTLQFSSEQKTRMADLAAKARSGELSENERSEADTYERISSLLGILQSRARISLSRTSGQ